MIIILFLALWIVCNLDRHYLQFGETKNYIVDNSSEYIDLNYLKSEDYIDNVVNDYIKEQLEYCNTIKSKSTSTRYLHQNIDTYIVNNNILSVKVTIYYFYCNEHGTMNCYSVAKGFNFNKAEKSEIALNSLFDSRYKQEQGDYDDSFVLTKNKVIFIKNSEDGFHEKEVKYKKLKDYNASYMLTKENYRISEKEYQKMFSE